MQGNTIIPIASEKWIRQCITKVYFTWRGTLSERLANLATHSAIVIIIMMVRQGWPKLQFHAEHDASAFRLHVLCMGNASTARGLSSFDSLWWIVMVFFIFSKLYPSVERAWNLVDFTVGTSIHGSSAKEFVMNFKSCANVLPRIVRLTC